ncbi:hypothetical protein [Paenibacillus sp. GCM10028914]|uniref:hypothetical protein n=1 Tax=Paenibacillus sp. GCM10028914 TaxID=3273416 RepID=UPI00360D6128
MHNIYPLSVDTCKPYIGRQVCAVLHDGRHITGTLKGVSERGLEFEEGYPSAFILSTKPAKAKKQINSMIKKAETSAFGPGYGYGYGFGYPGAALAWASIALLFLIPFAFI